MKQRYRMAEYVGGPSDGRLWILDAPEFFDASVIGREIRIPDGSVFVIDRLEGETIYLMVIHWAMEGAR